MPFHGLLSPKGTGVFFPAPVGNSNTCLTRSIRAVLFCGVILMLTGRQATAAGLQDFGFQNLKVNGKPALGHRPLLVIVVDFAGANPLAHNAPWYDSFVFDVSPTTQSVNGYYSEISNGRFSWSRGATIGPLALPGSNRYANFPNDTTYSSNLVWHAMVSGLFDFKAYDANADGHVTADELQIAIISNDGDGGGATRWAGQVHPEGSPVDWTGNVALLGHRGDFATLCHELSHTLGTLDLYGVWSQECLSYKVTLMSCTLGALESPEIYHLDPWHKMQLGWSEPRIFSLNASGNASVPSAQALEATGPIILYDPSVGTNEFFILEYRARNSPKGAGYDVNVADEGLALWHIHQEPNHYPTLTPRYDGGPYPGQENWRWCSKCQGMHFITDWQNPIMGICPSNGVHSIEGSGGYTLVQNIPNAAGQHGWRWCKKCQGLFYGPAAAQSHCPAGGTHDGSSSGDYSLVQNDSSSPGQHGWKWCNKCQGLFFGLRLSESRCPSDGSLHNDTGSGDYAMLLSGQNYAVWSEGPLNFGRGSSTLWHSDQTTPQLLRLDGTRTKTRLHVRPFFSGAGSITVDWFSELDTPPVLHIERTATNAAMISWPAACVDFSLEQSASVRPSNWTGVTNLPITVGIENQVIIVPLIGSRFYRLRSL